MNFTSALADDIEIQLEELAVLEVADAVALPEMGASKFVGCSSSTCSSCCC
ncbi:thiazolylpeptide-type bacteriocin [Amycolatopsis sp. lyj-108]|uniref:thiazolylpeptide-type bacteriocin n=1 Tax=Amycolatopsis sp. lyj-108 TaxID=2789286 RepID=UPI0039789CBD